MWKSGGKENDSENSGSQTSFPVDGLNGNRLQHRYLSQYAKYIENKGVNKGQYCFASISTTKTWIFMKLNLVINYYLVG